MSFSDNFSKYDDCAPAGVVLPIIKIEDKWYNKLNIDKSSSNDTFLLHLCLMYFKKKGLDKKENKQVYVDRIKKEYKILQKLGFIDYILLNWDILNWCHEQEIPTGAGRGSAAGSLILYLLDVTKVDSVKHGLFFERFVSESRARKIEKNGSTYLDGSLLADVDNDIAFDRRQEVIDYIGKRHPERTSRILNLVTLSGKICIKEVGKIVGNYTEQDMNGVSDLIPSHFGKVAKLAEAFEESEHFKKWATENPEVFSVAQKLEGLIKNTGVHASGIAISSEKLTNICPTQSTKEGHLITCYDMNSTADLSVKFDILGLKTLSVLKDASDNAGVDLDSIDIEKPDLYKHFQALDCSQGLFQIEADTNLHVCRTVRPRNLEEVSAVVAIARPGALQFKDDFAEYVQTGDFQTQHSLFNDILSYTAGIPLYQEQLMQMAVKIGFSLDEAEQLRRIVGKKKIDQMPAWKQKISDKIKEKGIDEIAGKILWKVAEDSANYSFNKSHSIAYAILAMKTVYMKFNHPLDFHIALLRNSKHEQDPYDIIDKIQKDLSMMGIKLLPPDLAKSEMDFSKENNNIRYGLNSIKGISEKTLQAIIDFRKEECPDLMSMFVAAKQAKINIAVLSSLIQAGALNSLVDGKRSKAALEAQLFNTLTDREKRIFMNLGSKYDYSCIKIWEKEIVDGPNIGDDGKPLIKPSRQGTIKNKMSPCIEIYKHNKSNPDFANWFFEKKLLGYNYSSRLKDCLSKKCLTRGLEELRGESEKVNFRSVGIVKESYLKRTKNNNKRYLSFVLSDERNEAKCFLWQEGLEKLEKNNQKIPQKDDIVVVVGQTMKDQALTVRDIKVFDTKIYMKMKDLKGS